MAIPCTLLYVVALVIRSLQIFVRNLQGYGPTGEA